MSSTEGAMGEDPRPDNTADLLQTDEQEGRNAEKEDTQEHKPEETVRDVAFPLVSSVSADVMLVCMHLDAARAKSC
jgi:hypothetical protein